MKAHGRKARGSLLDCEIPGSGDVTPLFHMTGLSHPGAGSPVRAASSQWARPRTDTRISASPGQRTVQWGESFRQRCVAVRFPVQFPVRRRSWLPYSCVCAAPCSVCATTGSACVSSSRPIFLVLSFVAESYDASCIWGGSNRKLTVRSLQRKRARTFEKVVKCFVWLVGQSVGCLFVCFSVCIALCRI